MRWNILKQFNKLPNEPSVRDMSEFDYLYCYIHMLLDNDSSYREFSVNENFNKD